MPYSFKLFTGFSRVANVALHNLWGHRAAADDVAAVAYHLVRAALFGIKVVLPWLARDKLPRAGNFDALAERFVGFHFSFEMMPRNRPFDVAVYDCFFARSSTVASPLGLLDIGSPSL